MNMQDRYRKIFSILLSIPYIKLKKIDQTVLVLFLCLVPNISEAFERYNNVVKYDKYFSKYSKRYFSPAFDWHYFKAQAIAESRLKASAKLGIQGSKDLLLHFFMPLCFGGDQMRSNDHPPLTG